MVRINFQNLKSSFVIACAISIVGEILWAWRNFEIVRALLFSAMFESGNYRNFMWFSLTPVVWVFPISFLLGLLWIGVRGKTTSSG